MQARPIIAATLTIAALVVLARRASSSMRVASKPRGDDFVALDPGGLGPVVIDAGPLLLPTVAPIAPAPESPALFDRLVGAVGAIVTKISAGTLPLGIRNNNPGNIRWISDARRRWRGMVRDDGRGYAIFATMADGTRALGKQLKRYRERGLDTPREIISTWAPPSENVTSAYVAAVADALGIAADARFDVGARLVDLAWAIARHENGAPFDTFRDPASGQFYTRAEFARWVTLP